MQEYYEEMLKVVNDLLEIPDHLAKKFSDEEHIFHKEYYRDQLGGLLIPAPIHTMALTKPLGYAGDYAMMLLIQQENPFQGHSSYFKLVNAASLRSPAARAVISRSFYLLNKMATFITNFPNENTLKLLSVGCGPAKEVQDFIKFNPKAGQCEFTLLDQDSEALAFTSARIAQIKNEYRSSIQVNYLNTTIQDFSYI